MSLPVPRIHTAKLSQPLLCNVFATTFNENTKKVRTVISLVINPKQSVQGTRHTI